MATTSISVTDAENFAKRLRDLIPKDLINKFYTQKPKKFDAGPDSMDAAGWLEAIVGDRSNAMPAHLEYLDKVFEGLADAIETLAATLTGTDADNAAALYALQMWVEDVNATKATPLPPGLKTNYESNDTGGNPELGWAIDSDGTVSLGQVSVNLDRDNRPNPGLFNDLADVYKEAGWKNEMPWSPKVDVSFTDSAS
jgi:hypothetical protein